MSAVRIDAHAHLGEWRHPGFLGLKTDLDDLSAELRRCGIEGVALTTSDQADNRALLQASRALPLQSWIFLWVRPGDPELPSLIEENRDLVRGLKLHPSLEQVPLDDRRWDLAFDLAAQWNLRMMIHTGRWQAAAGYGLALRRAETWPALQLILSHAGGDTPELCLGAATEVQRRRLENVAFDTAGLREHWALERAMRTAGPERYLLGSDYPLAHPAMYLAQIEAMKIPSSWKDGLLGENARRVLGEPSAREQQRSASLEESSSIEETMPRATASVGGAEHTVLITGAGGPIGVNLTRSLRLARRRLRLIGTDANAYHRPMALTESCLAVPRATDPSYLERLNAIIAEHGVDLVLPTHPVEVRALSALRDRVEARLFLPPHQTILTGQNKHAAYQRFRDAGVPVPRSMLVDAPADVERAFRELGPPPIWFRGSGVPGAGIGVASLPCRKPEHAAAWVDHHEGWGQFMASEYLPGENLTWLSVWHRGVLWGSQSRERLEYVIPHVSPSGITGAPAVSRTVCRPDLRGIGESAVRAVCEEPHGVFFVDLKADAAGVPRVTEINSGRFGTTLHFYTAAGLNFPELAIELAFDRLPPSPVHDPVPADTYWLRTIDCGPVLLRGRELDLEEERR